MGEESSGTTATARAAERTAEGDKGRDYFVAKQVRAGDLESDRLVWLQLPATYADDPATAMSLAAAMEDKKGTHEDGTTYMATGRWTEKPLTKKVETSFL